MQQVRLDAQRRRILDIGTPLSYLSACTPPPTLMFTPQPDHREWFPQVLFRSQVTSQPGYTWTALAFECAGHSLEVPWSYRPA